jgi:predicted O-methyltransferase YrrM
VNLTVDRFDRARAAADTVEGWLTPAEGELLFSLAASCPPGGTIVEIGSWKGKSTTWLAEGAGLASGIRVFAVDPHEPYLADPQADSLRDFRENLERLGLTPRVTAIVARSLEAAESFDRPIDLLFIDGDHEEGPATADVAVWLPKVPAGGRVAVHDVINKQWPGPRRALRRLMWRSTEITAVKFVDSIAWMRKVQRNTRSDRLRNRLSALVLMAYDIVPTGLPAPIAAVLRAIYRRTALKRKGST